MDGRRALLRGLAKRLKERRPIELYVLEHIFKFFIGVSDAHIDVTIPDMTYVEMWAHILHHLGPQATNGQHDVARRFMGTLTSSPDTIIHGG